MGGEGWAFYARFFGFLVSGAGLLFCSNNEKEEEPGPKPKTKKTKNFGEMGGGGLGILRAVFWFFGFWGVVYSVLNKTKGETQPQTESRKTSKMFQTI